jgi:hypothetical protein
VWEEEVDPSLLINKILIVKRYIGISNNILSTSRKRALNYQHNSVDLNGGYR